MRLLTLFICTYFVACSSSNDNKKIRTIDSLYIVSDTIVLKYKDQSTDKLRSIGNVTTVSLDTSKEKCYFIQKHFINKVDSVFIGFLFNFKTESLDTLFISKEISTFELLGDSNTLYIETIQAEEPYHTRLIFINRNTEQLKFFDNAVFLYDSSAEKMFSFYVFIPDALEQGCRFPYVQYEMNSNLEILSQRDRSVCE